MNMEKKIIKDLYCFLCSLQFDKRAIYDMHLSIIHNHIKRKDSFWTEIKNEPEEIESEIESNTLKYLINEHARLTISPLFSTLLALIRSCSLNYFSKIFLPAHKN